MQALKLQGKWEPREGYHPTERERAEQRADDGRKIFRHSELVLEDVPEPDPGPDDVIVRVEACGICGSDMNLISHDDDGYMLLAEPARLPVVMGHEFAGEVVHVGPQVRTLKVGDLVAVEAAEWCGACTACRIGEPGSCERLECRGFDIDGGFARLAVTKERYCWDLRAVAEAHGKAEALERGAMIEPMACAYFAMFIRAGGFLPGSHVAVVGAGPMGVMSMMLARYAGAETITAVDSAPERLKLAEIAGATRMVDASAGTDAVVEELMQESRGQGAAFIVEASGAGPRVYPSITPALALRGKVAQLGISGDPSPLDLVEFQVRQANVHASMGGSGHGAWRALIQAAAGTRLPMTSIITTRLPLLRGLDAMGLMRDRREGKILIKP